LFTGTLYLHVCHYGFVKHHRMSRHAQEHVSKKPKKMENTKCGDWVFMEYSSIETHTRCFLFQIDKEIDNEIYQDLMDFENSGETIVMDFCNPYDIRNLKPAKNWTQNNISLWEEFCNKHRTDDALIVQNVRNLKKLETARWWIVFKSSD